MSARHKKDTIKMQVVEHKIPNEVFKIKIFSFDGQGVSQ